MLENAVISVSTLVTYSFSAFKLYLFCCIVNLKMNSWQKDNFFLKHNKDNRFSFQCHIEACAPCCSPTLLWLFSIEEKGQKRSENRKMQRWRSVFLLTLAFYACALNPCKKDRGTQIQMLFEELPQRRLVRGNVRANLWLWLFLTWYSLISSSLTAVSHFKC